MNFKRKADADKGTPGKRMGLMEAKGKEVAAALAVLRWFEAVRGRGNTTSASFSGVYSRFLACPVRRAVRRPQPRSGSIIARNTLPVGWPFRPLDGSQGTTELVRERRLSCRPVCNLILNRQPSALAGRILRAGSSSIAPIH